MHRRSKKLQQGEKQMDLDHNTNQDALHHCFALFLNVCHFQHIGTQQDVCSWFSIAYGAVY